MTNAPMAIARSQPGRLLSSESLLFRDIQTDKPHSGQRRASRILRRLYPQRMHGFSRALGSLLMRTSGIGYEKYSGIPPLDRHAENHPPLSPRAIACSHSSRPIEENPHPNPLPAYREREQEGKCACPAISPDPSPE